MIPLRTTKNWAAKPRRKYGNTPTEYNGVRYHSAREAAYAAELDLLVRAGEIVSWQRQVPFDLKVNGTLICRYVIDFVCIGKGIGSWEAIEVKGHKTPEWKLKWALFNALYPNLKKRVVK